MALSLYVQDPAGLYRLATHDEVLAAATRHINQRFRRGSALTSSHDTRQYLIPKFANLEREHFGAIYLDTRHRIINFIDHFQGSVDRCNVYARVLCQTALKLNASAVILCHNHPSGDPSPSQADITLTQRLSEVLRILDVRILDHVVLAGGECVSMMERGHISA